MVIDGVVETVGDWLDDEVTDIDSTGLFEGERVRDTVLLGLAVEVREDV